MAGSNNFASLAPGGGQKRKPSPSSLTALNSRLGVAIRKKDRAREDAVKIARPLAVAIGERLEAQRDLELSQTAEAQAQRRISTSTSASEVRKAQTDLSTVRKLSVKNVKRINEADRSIEKNRPAAFKARSELIEAQQEVVGIETVLRAVQAAKPGATSVRQGGGLVGAPSGSRGLRT